MDRCLLILFQSGALFLVLCLHWLLFLPRSRFRMWLVVSIHVLFAVDLTVSHAHTERTRVVCELIDSRSAIYNDWGHAFVFVSLLVFPFSRLTICRLLV